MVPQRFQNKGPKSQILLLFEFSKHRARNATLENQGGASEAICVRGVAYFAIANHFDNGSGKDRRRIGEAFSPGRGLWGRLKIKINKN